MYTIYDYMVSLSLNNNFENKTGYYNFPAWNSFRRIGLQALYDSKYLSKEFLNELLNEYLAFPILSLFHSKRFFSFCPCDVVANNNMPNFFSHFHLDIKYDDKILPINYISHDYRPATLLNQIDRNFKVVIPTPKCSLEFLRKCLRYYTSPQDTIDNCFKTFFPKASSISFTFDLFWFNNQSKEFGYSESGKLVTPKGFQNEIEYLCVFVYLTQGAKNVMFVLTFPPDYEKIVIRYDEIKVNGETFSYIHGKDYHPYMYTSHWWGYQGINRCNNHFCWEQYEFLPLPKF